MKRYDAWSEPDPQCNFGGGRCELYERTLGQYVTFDDHERAIAAVMAECDRLAAENAELRYWKQGNIRCAAQLAAATATLDALRVAIRRQHAELFYMMAAQYLSVGFDAKKETDNG